jgi:plastocyanin
MRRPTTFAGAALLAMASIAPSARASLIEVHLKDQSFRPGTVSAKPGDAIVFINDDKEVHSVFLPDAETLLAEHFIEPHVRYEVAIPATAVLGTYKLVCTIHMMMKGTLRIIAK